MLGASLVRSRILLSVLLGAGLVAGCGQTAVPPRPGAQATSPVVPPDPAATVEMRLVTSSELQDAIQAQKGKIVVVDFWATWCMPCRKEFPHLIEMDQKFRDSGVACMSVSVDDEADRALALTFLRDQQATFPNFLLNEDANVWQERWSIKGVPVVYVYDRDGKRAQKFDKDDPDNQFSYADVNKLVEQLLARTE